LCATQRQEFLVGGDKGRSVSVEYRYEAKRGGGQGTQRDPNAHFYIKVGPSREYPRVVLHQQQQQQQLAINGGGEEGRGWDELDVSVDGLRRRYVVNAAEDRIFVHSDAFGEITLILKSRYHLLLCILFIIFIPYRLDGADTHRRS
jgi:hypothetical protein